MVFTGLVKCVGRATFDPTSNIIYVGIFKDGIPVTDFWNSEEEGASIAVNGCCLTLLKVSTNHVASFFMMEETRDKVNLVDVCVLPANVNPEQGLTTFYSYVNVEPALRHGDPYGGHTVTGHVDTVQTITTITNCPDGSLDIWINLPPQCHIVHKGSITINGVSLTVAQLDPLGRLARVSVIPHTQHATTFQYLQEGDKVNVEFDQALKILIEHKTTVNMTGQELDELYMRQAITLGLKGQCTSAPNPWVGCVIVASNGTVIGQGYHEKAGQGHAEVQAIANVRQQYGDNTETLLSGATCYVTLEPCSHTGRTGPCMLQLIKYKFARVVVGLTDPDPLVAGKGITGLTDAGITVEVGVLAQECRSSLKSYLKHRTTGKPWVVCKIATSLDGKLADAYGTSQWITSEESRTDAQLRWRATSQAIVVGSNTAKVDNPQLTVRAYPDHVKRELVTPPIRVIVGKNVEIPSYLSDTTLAPTLVFTSVNSDHEQLKSKVSEVVTVKLDNRSQIDFNEVLLELGKRGVLQVLVEGGAQLCSSLLRDGYVDQLVWYIAPVLLPGGKLALSNKTPVSMEDAKLKSLYMYTTSRCGDDLCVEYTKEKFC